ncbi:endonuclease/exonuclease/phosphatase family protein [Defluviimonas aestuarii]|uniref:endonuclease/exonuclease/phosphatase family protein n=1 Tax=Albidovulum aestuarii TaxID=1130726 RepID=UPI00249A38A7|nr:endonuclease/exonuclease/phosphatase family protein [Defluviimonas aestuarii]MDI3335609.1 endonuclease/exonuclease/phosphatase family protein [Defluviimonas aestuarii]
MLSRLLPGLIVGIVAAVPAAAETTLRIMSYNIWGGGGNEGKGVEETVAVLKAANPDIIGMQETRLEPEDCTAEACAAVGESVAKEIAEALGYYYYDQTQENVALWANAILSRYPIGAATGNDLGVPIDVDGVTVWAFNIHHDDEPYQPYQLLGIEYGPAPFIKTEAEAQDWANQTRGPAMDILFEDMQAAEGAAAVFVFGDFNEPSEYDWTDAAVAAGQQPVKVEWPTTHRLSEAGFVDTYRAANPDPVAKPAYTWTPQGDEADPEDHHDRIDFAFAKADGLTVTGAWIVGETGPRSDLAVDPWPSDHRATLAEVSF